MSDIFLDKRIMQAQLAAFGQEGHEIRVSADGETAADSIYFAIAATEETDIDYHDRITDTSVAGLVVPAGFTIYGELDLVTVNSGKVIAYIGDLKAK